MNNEVISPENQISADDPWAMTDEVMREIAEAKIGIEQSRREFESQILRCPFDGGDSIFVRYGGAYTRGWAIFRCKVKSQEFQVG